MGALQGQGLAANGADAGHVSAPGQQSLAEGTGVSTIPIRNGTGTANDAVAPDTAGRDGNGPGATPPTPVAADQLRAIMPHAGAAADRYADAVNQAMTAHGINTPERRAAFLAQVATESRDLHDVVERMDYASAQRIQRVWPRRFHTEAEAAPFVHDPEALANRVYAKRGGNGDEASGDGFRFRGRGLIQVTGRDRYRRLGFEDSPEALAEPENAANSAAAYWQDEGLNERTSRVLDRAQLDAVSRTVNGGDTGLQERWNAYQRALDAFNVGR